MSKSKGNFFTLRDLLQEGWEPRALRYMLLSVHYRRVLDLTKEALAAASQNLQRLDDFAARLESEDAAGAGEARLAAALATARSRFDDSLDDDLNTAGALGALFELVREVNAGLDKGLVGADDLASSLAFLADFEAIFGIPLGQVEKEAPENVTRLIEAREEARRQRDYTRADEIRQQLLKQGIVLEDTPKGTRWKRTKPD